MIADRWIPISERQPEFPCALGCFRSGDGSWVICATETAGFPKSWTHWCPLPEPPQNEDEKAWEEWAKARDLLSKSVTQLLRATFLAGLQRGRGK